MHPFFPLFNNMDRPLKERMVHGLRNVGYGLLNAIAIRFVFLALWIRAMEWSAASQFGVANWLPGTGWWEWAIVILLLDASLYLWHRASHAIPLLWRLHKLHHADRQMDVTTANRFHLGEVSLSALFRIPVLVGLGCQLEMLAVYEICFFAVVQFHHANIGVPESVDRVLRAVIVTPHLHKVHHSTEYEQQNANFSSLFSWWDRIARTFRIAPDLTKITFGVDEGT